MKFIFVAAALVLSFPYAVQTSEAPGQREVRVQKSNLTRDQEIRLGEQTAAMAERKLRVIKNAEIEQWLSGVGAKLSATAEAREYPYRFRLVDSEAAGATSFPGGLVYVNTGLLSAANSESEVVGVLAHEMSHVALRHGAARETKAREWKTALQVAGIAAGVAGVGMAGPAINLGGDAGLKAAMSGKYSPESERDADLNGARMMAAAGYDPESMADSLERLSQSGASPKAHLWARNQREVTGTAQRAELIRSDIRFYPARTYGAESGRFADIQMAVSQIGKASGFISATGTK